MWVGPGGFIGNFTFRFTKDILFFQNISLLHLKCNLLFTRNGFCQLAILFVSADTVQKLRFYNLLEDRKRCRITL